MRSCKSIQTQKISCLYFPYILYVKKRERPKFTFDHFRFVLDGGQIHLVGRQHHAFLPHLLNQKKSIHISRNQSLHQIKTQAILLKKNEVRKNKMSHHAEFKNQKDGGKSGNQPHKPAKRELLE